MELLEKSILSENLLQVSGMRIVYDLSDSSGVKVVAAEVAGNPMEPQKTYKVATNDFLATAGGAFNIFKQGSATSLSDHR